MRSKETIKSVIGDIPGIGKVRQRELLRYFGSLEEIKKAGLAALAKAPKVDKKLAQNIYFFFRKNDE